MFGKEQECRLSRQEIDARVAELMGRMSLKEKVLLLNGHWDVVRNQIKYKNPYNPTPIKTKGLKRLGIPPIAFSDGPRGVVMGRSTCFPVSMARGATFDPDLERRIGEVIGREARAQAANFFGGVCINLLRHPAWGRAQETYGEDPFLLGEMAAALTTGVQRHNVMACLKHYAVNNIENSRFHVNVETDERTLREVYLPHFRRGVEAGAASVMGAYNKFRGDHVCESRHLLHTILRETWGFEGFTISDFIYGIRDTKKAIEAGLDVEMPMPIHYNKKLLRAVQSGKVSEATVDQALSRVLRTVLVFANTPDPERYAPELVASQEHTSLAREAAEQSMVLIKNDAHALPLPGNPRRILVVGSLAAKENTGDHGSSRVYAPYVVTPLEGIRRYLEGQAATVAEVLHCEDHEIDRARELAGQVDAVVIVAGNDYNDEGEFVVPESVEGEHPLVTGTRNQGMLLKTLLVKAIVKRLGASYTSDSGEAVGGDRQNLGLKEEQLAMIRAVGGINPHTVVALVGGSMIIPTGWGDAVPAVLYGWYAGMEGGTALARILFGEVSPEGKLPFTVPQREEDLPFFSFTDREIEYDRYHGYTLLDARGIEPAYPFGFGLSYTSFALSGLDVQAVPPAISASVTVENTGDRPGAEVVQLYIGKPDSAVDRAEKLLKAFAKVRLDPGESRRLTLTVPRRELAFYDPDQDDWIVEPGNYRVHLGTSSATSALQTRDVQLADFAGKE
jgi:beta-glucosidase